MGKLITALLSTMLLAVPFATLLAAGPATQPAPAAVAAPAPPSGGPAHMKKEMMAELLQDRDDRMIVRLENGLVIIAQEVKTAPVVSAQVWIKTGSIYEQEHVGAGLSHFLEHLASGGSTTRRTDEQSNAILGRIGGQTNAATGLETVNYYINTTSDHTDTAIDLLSDWMQHSTITDREYKREQEVIQREFEHGLGSPNRVLWKLTQQARYTVHPARHPTIGYIDEFMSVTRDEIYDFYKRMYVPNNMVFVVVGDIEKEKVVSQLRLLWKDAKPGELPEVSLPEEAEIDGPRELTGEAAIRTPQLRLAWPGTRLGGEHDYALDLLGSLLGQGESSRLVRVVRDEEKLVNSIDAYNLSFAWGDGFFGVDCEVAVPPGAQNADELKGQVDAAIANAKAAILNEVHRIHREGVTGEELDRARRKALAYTVYSSQSAQAIGRRMARDLIGMGNPDYMDYYVKALEKITAADVQNAAKAILADDRLITIRLMPQVAGADPQPLKRPEEAAVGDDVVFEPVDLDNAAMLARFAKVASDQGEARKVDVGPIKTYTMPNGLRLLVQRNTRVPAVSMQLYMLGGLLAETPGREGQGNAMAEMMTKGTTTRSAREIERTVEDLGASINAASGNNTFYIQAQSLSEDFPVMFDLFADVLLHPSFPEDEWVNVQRVLLASIDRQQDSWGGELSLAFKHAYFGDKHPWSQSTLGRRDVVESLKVADLKAYHRTHLSARDSVLAVFGDVDPDKVAAMVKAKFAELPAESMMPFDPPVAKAPVAGLYHATTNKQLAAIQIGFGPGVTRAHADYPALTVLSNVISDFPTGWLEQALRGDGPGLAYAVWAYNVSGMAPGYLAAGFNTNPKQVEEALSRTMDVIRRARDHRVDDATLARAKAKVLSREYLGKQTNSDRAAEAALRVLYGLDGEGPDEFLKKVRAVDAEMLQIVAQTYLTNPVATVLSHQAVNEDTLKPMLSLEPDAATSAE